MITQHITSTPVSQSSRLCAGFTLLEIVIVMLIFSIISTAALTLLISSQNVFGSGTTIANLENQARRIVEQLANEIQQSSVSRLSPAPPALPEYLDSMTYQINIGYVNGVIQWSTPITLAFQYAAGETDDGIDNNGNGMIDEGFLTRTQDGVTQYITYWVKDDGFHLSIDRNKLRIHLELENTNNRGTIMETSVETIVELKNPSPK